MKNIEVSAAVLRKGNKIFATQRGYGQFKDWWEFPGGKIEPGETPQEALRREMKEEMALEVEVGELIRIVEWDYPDFHLRMHCFWASAEGEPQLLEHEAALWVGREEALSLKWLPADVEVLQQIVEEL